MPALAETLSTSPSQLKSRSGDRPICKICSDQMIAAEVSALLPENVISHLWSCDTCGYGFVTKHDAHPQPAD